MCAVSLSLSVHCRSGTRAQKECRLFLFVFSNLSQSLQPRARVEGQPALLSCSPRRRAQLLKGGEGAPPRARRDDRVPGPARGRRHAARAAGEGGAVRGASLLEAPVEVRLARVEVVADNAVRSEARAHVGEEGGRVERLWDAVAPVRDVHAYEVVWLPRRRRRRPPAEPRRGVVHVHSHSAYGGATLPATGAAKAPGGLSARTAPAAWVEAERSLRRLGDGRVQLDGVDESRLASDPRQGARNAASGALPERARGGRCGGRLGAAAAEVGGEAAGAHTEHEDPLEARHLRRWARCSTRHEEGKARSRRRTSASALSASATIDLRYSVGIAYGCARPEPPSSRT